MWRRGTISLDAVRFVVKYWFDCDKAEKRARGEECSEDEMEDDPMGEDGESTLNRV
jgi:hypothetical protein